MKKYILIILAVLIMATILLAKNEMVIYKEIQTGLYTIKVDDKIVFQTKSKNELIKYQYEDKATGVIYYYKFYYLEERPNHHKVVHCVQDDWSNNCARMAVNLL